MKMFAIMLLAFGACAFFPSSALTLDRPFRSSLEGVTYEYTFERDSAPTIENQPSIAESLARIERSAIEHISELLRERGVNTSDRFFWAESVNFSLVHGEPRGKLYLVRVIVRMSDHGFQSGPPVQATVYQYVNGNVLNYRRVDDAGFIDTPPSVEEKADIQPPDPIPEP